LNHVLYDCGLLAHSRLEFLFTGIALEFLPIKEFHIYMLAACVPKIRVD